MRFRQGKADRADRREATAGDLALVGLGKSFGRDRVVDDLSLDVPRGSFFALVGPSGCGKTTTLRMVAGLERPDAGQIVLGSQDITELRPHERPVNTVFQSYALFPHLNVGENVAFGPRRRGVDPKVVGAQVADALAMVDLAGLESRRPGQLSGGQQQRVALARALVNRPELLLLDEPLGALDLKLRRQMQVELKRIQAETGITFVHVTHDQEEALSMADTVAVMNHGGIEQMGAPAELYELPRTAFVANFLGQSNLAEATVVGHEGELVELELAGQRVRALRSRSADPSARTALVGVRPEKVRVVAEGARVKGKSITNLLGRAVVADVSFLGVATQYLLDVPGAGRWVVHEQNRDVDAGARPGDVVSLAWDLRHTFTLPGTEDPLAGTEENIAQIEQTAAAEAASLR